jgi:hypothetical protein
MRWIWPILIGSSVAAADDPADGTGIRMRRLEGPSPEPWLHLDATMPDFVDAAGGIADGRAAILDLGPRLRLAAEGTWWQTGLSPSIFAEDLEEHGWSAAAELSYDLGPLRIGMNVATSRFGDGSRRMAGLFAFRSFRLSRWMRAWILVGAAFEQWDGAGLTGPTRGASTGFTLGTTFR